MLPKKKRITKALFQTIMKNGKVIHSPLFLFRYIKHSTPAYAFVVPKTVAKGAVARNSLRRKGYGGLRAFPLKPIAGVFFYKKHSGVASHSQLAENITQILSKISF